MRRQGADRAALKERAHDLYETPAIATHALLRVERLAERIWEPSAGRGAIMRELVAAGHQVVASDLVAYDGADPGIATPIDFLLEHQSPPGCVDLVTNPPYKLANDFIRHGLTLVPRVIVLLRLMALEGAGRSDLIDRHLRRVWVGIERLPTMHRDGWQGQKLSMSTAPFAWFVFESAPRGDAPVELRRMSWRSA